MCKAPMTNNELTEALKAVVETCRVQGMQETLALIERAVVISELEANHAAMTVPKAADHHAPG